MALITRLSRLFQADFNAVLDRIEEPELQLRQAVREMQLAQDQDCQRRQMLGDERAQLDKLDGELAERLRRLDEELDICLAAGEDDLGRDLVRRKLAAERQRAATRDQAERLDATIARLARTLEEQEQQLASMRQKLELLVGDAARPGPAFADLAGAVRNEEIEIALLREKQRRAEA